MSTSSLARAEPPDDLLGVGARGVGRRPVRHQDAQQPLRADRLGDEVRDERRVDPARQAEDEPLEAGLAELAADELADDPARDVGVDRELVGQLEERLRRRRREGGVVIGGPSPAPWRAPRDLAEADRLADRVAGRDVEAGLGEVVGGRVEASPARSATIRVSSRTWSSGRSSRRSGSASRSRRRSASGTSTMNRPSSKSGALNSGWPLGAITSEPPQNEIDSSTPTRLQNTTNDVVSWAYVRISVRHDVAVPRPTSFVAARSRPGDDETLIRIWAPSRASSWGTVRCQKSSQIAIPTPDPEPRRRRPQEIARGEEPPLVEQAVRRQEQLPVDVPDPAVLEQRGGDEQAVVGRFLDERDDDRQVRRSRPPARPGADRRAGSRPPPRGPGAGSRSGRAPGRRRGRRPRPRASSISS